MNTEPVKNFTEADILDKGLAAFREVLNQKVSVTRSDMADLLNFEIVVTNMAHTLRQLEGKTPEEILALRPQPPP